MDAARGQALASRSSCNRVFRSRGPLRAGARLRSQSGLPRFGGCHLFPPTFFPVTIALGSGLQELLDDQNAMEDARVTTDIGLLNGMDVSNGQPQAIGRRLPADVVAPLRIATG